VIASRARPLAQSLAPRTAAWRVALVVGASILVALSAQVSIPLPLVPITLQTYAVLVVAVALGRLAAPALGLYVLEGVAGLPVFAGGTAGAAVLFGPRGGYLAGFVLAAAIVGALAEHGWDRHVLTALAAMLAGEVAIYALGLPWLARFVPAERVLDVGLMPFIAGDLVKLVLAAATPLVAWRALARLR